MYLNKFKILSQESLIVNSFFLVYFFVGISIFMDYGIHADDNQQRVIGQTSLHYLVNIFGLSAAIKGYPQVLDPIEIFNQQVDKDYGVAFELPAEALIKLFGIEDDLGAFYFRHFLTFTFFFLASTFFYRLIKERWSSWKWGLLGVICFVLSPRIFADSFYNSKDLVFLSIITISLYTLYRFLSRPTLSAILVHAFICAYAIDVRIMGVILPAMTFLGAFLMALRKEWTSMQSIKTSLFFSVACMAFVVAMWPWLWANPLGNFLLAFQNMSKFRHSVNMIFLGETINSKQVPWFYLPVWISITTPVLYLTCFVAGLLVVLRKFSRPHKFHAIGIAFLYDSLVLLIFLSPILATIALQSVLYNGWRQLYFIYAAFIYIAIYGAHSIYSLQNKLAFKRAFKYTFTLIFSISWITTAIWMSYAHPYQYLYFNLLSGNWVNNYDLDYWGLAYRKPMEKIFATDDHKTKYIFNDMFWKFDSWQLPVWSSLAFISPSKRGLFKGITSEECSDYVIATMQNGAKHYSNMPGYSLIDEIKVDNHVIYATFKRNIPMEEAFPLKSGVDLNFGKDFNGRCFLKKGWFTVPEDWGVWSDQKLATISLRVPKDHPKQIILGLRAFVGPKNQIQRLYISVNDRNLPHVNLTEFENNIVKIPLTNSDRGESELSINLEIPDAVSPSQLGLSDDPRLLGVGLKFIRFE